MSKRPQALRTAARASDASAVRELVTILIRKSKKDRERIAAEMSELLRYTVTKRSLDSYTSESSDQNRWPAQYDIAFCEVVGNYRLLQERVRRAGFRMVGPDEEKLIRLGKAVLAKAKAERELAEGVSL